MAQAVRLWLKVVDSQRLALERELAVIMVKVLHFLLKIVIVFDAFDFMIRDCLPYFLVRYFSVQSSLFGLRDLVS